MMVNRAMHFDGKLEGREETMTQPAFGVFSISKLEFESILS